MKLAIAAGAIFVLGGAVIGACHDPMVPLNANTTRTCPDGTVCPNWQDCPSYARPGVCGGYSAPTPQWEKASPPAPDAGSFTTEPDDPNLGEPPPGRGGRG